MKGVFITGTDTGVGKTFIAGLIVRALQEYGIDIGVMKPVETGCRIVNKKSVPHDALFLKKIAQTDDHLDLINPYRFKEPLAPSAAARKEDRQIKLRKIETCFKKLLVRHNFMVVEGAGGLLAPLNNKETMGDLIKLLRLPVIIVAASRLGAINHTLLTVKCLNQLKIKTLGIIFNKPTSDKNGLFMNASEVKRFTDVPVICEVPFIKMEDT